MKGFLLGLLVAGLGFGGYFYWQHVRTVASRPTLSAADSSAPVTSKKARKHGCGALGPAASDSLATGEPESQPVRLSAADLPYKMSLAPHTQHLTRGG